MFLRAVTSSVLAIGLCIPLIASAHSTMKHKVKHGNVTCYYSANGRIYAKEIDNVMYYRSSPEYLVPGYRGGDVHTHVNAPYYTQYAYKKYSNGRYTLVPYHWSYVYRVR